MVYAQFKRKLVLLDPPSLSATLTVMVALPNWLVTGRKLKVRLPPLPP